MYILQFLMPEAATLSFPQYRVRPFSLSTVKDCRWEHRYATVSYFYVLV
jgi:hypothetical protein